MIPKIVLFSTSPQRKALVNHLAQLCGFRFVAHAPEYHERSISYGNPRHYTKAMAIGKFKSALLHHGALNHPQNILISADTTVAYRNHIFNKPQSREAAQHILQFLSGKRHAVYSSVLLQWRTKQILFTEKTTIAFNTIGVHDLQRYLDREQWQRYAGGYRIQNIAAPFIKSINGSHSNVIGLPVSKVYAIINTINIKHKR